MSKINLKTILKHAEENTILDKDIKLNLELSTIKDYLNYYFKNSSIYVNKNSDVFGINEPDFLTVKFKRGLFKTNPVLSHIFPQIAGGSDKNRYDALLNDKMLGHQFSLPNLVESAIQSAGLEFGNFHNYGILNFGLNDIQKVNNSYTLNDNNLNDNFGYANLIMKSSFDANIF